MKALFINASPRKDWTTATMLESAKKGAQAAGAQTEIIHLYDYKFKGCVSCFACKLKGAKTSGLCAQHDELRPILQKALEADVLVLGSPVYFSYPTSAFRAFIERLMFPSNSYNPTFDEQTGEYKNLALGKKIATGTIYTMGAPEKVAVQNHYPEVLGENDRFLAKLFGSCESVWTYNAYQFDDYTKYDVQEGTEKFRRTYRDEQFPVDLQKAYQMGVRLAEKAKPFA